MFALFLFSSLDIVPLLTLKAIAQAVMVSPWSLISHNFSRICAVRWLYSFICNKRYIVALRIRTRALVPPTTAVLYSLHMAKDWTHLFEKYRGKWVALAEDEITVLAAADTAKEARDAALKRSLLPILYQVPDTLDLFAGYAL
jgi:Family of unknown function (DUF5678)